MACCPRFGVGACLSFTSTSQSNVEGSQGRSSRQEPEGRYRSKDHGGALLIGLFCIGLPSLHSPDPPAQHGTAHIGWGLPPSTECRQANLMSTGQSDEGSPSIESSSSRCHSFVTKPNQHRPRSQRTLFRTETEHYSGSTSTGMVVTVQISEQEGQARRADLHVSHGES